jgi:methylmalonyl-CoA/ethylmalonyl-CoA epimerase
VRLHQIAQHADDLDRATAFYRDVVGLPHLATFEPPGLAFFDLGGGTRLLLEGGAPSAVLYLGVDDLEAAWARITSSGVEIVAEPHTIHVHDGTLGPAGAEERMAFFEDSEGNTVALASMS